jgi:predicted nuclease of predicted toxin-antitoxin system
VQFLADAGISPRTVDFLQERGHSVVHVHAIGMASASDREVMQRAASDSSIVLTFDLDFGDILALGVLDRPSVILFRLTDERADAVNKSLATVLDECQAALASGALILVEDTRHRVRRLPIVPAE